MLAYVLFRVVLFGEVPRFREAKYRVVGHPALDGWAHDQVFTGGVFRLLFILFNVHVNNISQMAYKIQLLPVKLC